MTELPQTERYYEDEGYHVVVERVVARLRQEDLLVDEQRLYDLAFSIVDDLFPSSVAIVSVLNIERRAFALDKADRLRTAEQPPKGFGGMPYSEGRP